MEMCAALWRSYAVRNTFRRHRRPRGSHGHVEGAGTDQLPVDPHYPSEGTRPSIYKGYMLSAPRRGLILTFAVGPVRYSA